MSCGETNAPTPEILNEKEGMLDGSLSKLKAHSQTISIWKIPCFSPYKTYSPSPPQK